MENIRLPNKPVIKKNKDNLAVFEIKPCYPGYGITIGNALRRVLLSSIPGTAITSIKITGVKHEFSTIPYIMEDVVNIILNIKQINLIMHTREPQTLHLSVKGEKRVLARDIKTTADVEIVNKNALIATLTDKKASLEMELKVEKGLGYYPVEQRTEQVGEIGVIAMDAFFTPIKKVNYTVENIRIGKRTDFNKLILEIETDGSITPEHAFIKAANMLVEHFEIFASKDKKFKKYTKNKPKAKAKVKARPALKALPKQKKVDPKTYLIDSLKISGRSAGVLRDARIKTIASLIRKTEDKLKELPGLGNKGVREIKRELGKLGFLLKTK